jgi:hypothetical protein
MLGQQTLNFTGLFAAALLIKISRNPVRPSRSIASESTRA